MMDDDLPLGAEKVTSNLDLLVELDEPEQFVWAAVQATANRARWDQVHAVLLALEKEMAARNEPPPKHDTSDAPEEA
jgi:hypothetical protein